jgi:NTE family protein
MRALVLSGGGAKGAYEVGAIKYLLGELNRDYGILCGVSVGALNASFLSMYARGDERKASTELEQMWLTIDDRHVYRRWCLWPLSVLWRPSVFNSKPLQDLVRSNLEPARLQSSGKKLRVGAVDLGTGVYRTWNERDADIVDGVLASSAFPAFLTPVEIGGKLYTDGGVRDVTPLEDAFQLGATEIDVVVCSPAGVTGAFKNKPKTLDVALRALATMEAEIDRWDLKVADLYNQLAALHAVEGKRQVPIRVLRPTEDILENSLGFDPGKIVDNIQRGYNEAKKVDWDAQ